MMIVRNINDPEVIETTFSAHGGGIARMVLDQRILKKIGFMAIGLLPSGKSIEAHRDPYEEIYFILEGSGEMQVDNESKAVGPGDATWIPMGSLHSLTNKGMEDCTVLVIASPMP